MSLCSDCLQDNKKTCAIVIADGCSLCLEHFDERNNNLQGEEWKEKALENCERGDHTYDNESQNPTKCIYCEKEL